MVRARDINWSSPTRSESLWSKNAVLMGVAILYILFSPHHGYLPCSSVLYLQGLRWSLWTSVTGQGGVGWVNIHIHQVV